MEPMNYQETLDYLYTTLPMFQRVGAAAYKNDLANTIALCEALGNPQHKFKSVHIAGTNGKGSSSHMIAAVLQSAGYKTGLYTSPHLKEFTERIRINGLEVSREFIVSFVERIKSTLETIHPSFFETTVAMAFEYFAAERVDISVIEVGLGGRLDSTNVITPLVSLITNIGNDHKDLLGDTLQKIAFEKAGIIKPKVPAVVSERQTETAQVFEEKAMSENAPLHFASDHYKAMKNVTPEGYTIYKDGIKILDEFDCELKGTYQRKNIPGVLMVIDQLREFGYDIDDDALRKGVAHVVSLTGLKGRWQKLSDHPLTICDIGHNEDGIREVVEQIRTINAAHLYIIFGMVKDKDVTSVLILLPNDATYYFCQAKIPRAMPAAELAVKASEVGLVGIVIEDVNEALKQARSHARHNDLIFIGGSTFVVAEIADL
jgi:dihydrofolate synthase/folylpolyglutamate synthase